MKKIILIAITILTLGFSTTTFAENEGIKVHGHWTFDIYNADGSFDRKVEFDNALTAGATGGGAFLAKFVAEVPMADGSWSIRLDNSPPGNPVCDTQNSFVGCQIIPDSSSLSGNEYSKNLQVTLGGNFLDKVFFTGSFTVQDVPNPGINSVEINWEGANYHSFTQKTFQLPINLTFGQIVQVKIEISFS